MHRNDQWDDLSRFKEAVEQTKALYEIGVTEEIVRSIIHDNFRELFS